VKVKLSGRVFAWAVLVGLGLWLVFSNPQLLFPVVVICFGARLAGKAYLKKIVPEWLVLVLVLICLILAVSIANGLVGLFACLVSFFLCVVLTGRIRKERGFVGSRGGKVGGVLTAGC